MNSAQLDFQQLRIKHIHFKSKVRSVLYGGSYDAAFFSSEGPINLWFNTIGQAKYKYIKEMDELNRVHQSLNSIAQDLIRLYQNGKIDQAHDGLIQLNVKSEEFISLLQQLERRADDLVS